jgi:hypothetical protein
VCLEIRPHNNLARVITKERGLLIGKLVVPIDQQPGPTTLNSAPNQPVATIIIFK